MDEELCVWFKVSIHFLEPDIPMTVVEFSLWKSKNRNHKTYVIVRPYNFEPLWTSFDDPASDLSEPINEENKTIILILKWYWAHFYL